MKRRVIVSLGLALLAVLIVGPPPKSALADGIIIIDPPIEPIPGPIPIRDMSLTIKYHRVDVTIENNEAKGFDRPLAIARSPDTTNVRIDGNEGFEVK